MSSFTNITTNSHNTKLPKERQLSTFADFVSIDTVNLTGTAMARATGLKIERLGVSKPISVAKDEAVSQVSLTEPTDCDTLENGWGPAVHPTGELAVVAAAEQDMLTIRPIDRESRAEEIHPVEKNASKKATTTKITKTTSKKVCGRVLKTGSSRRQGRGVAKVVKKARPSRTCNEMADWLNDSDE